MLLNSKHGIIIKTEIIVAEVSSNGKFAEESNWQNSVLNQSTVILKNFFKK